MSQSMSPNTVFLTLSNTVFAILRMFGILQSHPYRTWATWTLLALVLTVFILNTVRMVPNGDR